jgi:hypothetical protein
MNVGGMKMVAGAALCLGALALGAHQLHQDFAVGGGGNRRVPVDEKRAQTVAAVAGLGGNLLSDD